MVIVGDAIDSFGDSLAVGVVGVGDTSSIFFHAHELPAMLPCVSPCAVREGVADGVVGDGSAVVGRQQILPLAVAVGLATRQPCQKTGLASGNVQKNPKKLCASFSTSVDYSTTRLHLNSLPFLSKYQEQN